MPSTEFAFCVPWFLRCVDIFELRHPNVRMQRTVWWPFRRTCGEPVHWLLETVVFMWLRREGY